MSYSSPGIYIEATVTQSNRADLVTPSVCYMLGSAISGSMVATVNTAVSISSVSDFVAKFGVDSPSYKHVKMFLAQYPRGLFFVNVSNMATALASITANSDMGVIIAPEMFEEAEDVPAAVILANQLIAHAEATRNFVLIDPHPSIKSTVGSSNTQGVWAYRIAVNDSPNAAMYFPYLIDLENNELAPSSAMAGVYLKTFSDTRYGIAKSPAGFKHTLSNVASLSREIVIPNDTDTLNPIGVNSIIKKNRLGVAAYGARTLADPLRYINTSLILITQSRALSEAYEQMMFETIDTRGELFRRDKKIADEILARQWAEGQMVGATPVESYRVVCDSTNNTTENLSNGILQVDIYQSPAGTVEVIIITPHQIPFGTLNEVLSNR